MLTAALPLRFTQLWPILFGEYFTLFDRKLMVIYLGFQNFYIG